jgi:energy-coupling factor transport system ATP-binding protein
VLSQLQLEKKSVIVATHDIEFVAQIASRILVLGEGVAVDQRSVDEILSAGNPLASQVSQALKTPGLVAVKQVIA